MAIVALALVVAGCGLSRQDAIDELVAVGYQAESAECIVASVEEQGYESSELADPVAPEVEAAIEVAVEQCITAADAVSVAENLDDGEFREQVLAELTGDGMERAQAECIVATIEVEGFTVADLARIGIGGSAADTERAEAVVDALRQATVGCQ